MRIAESVLLMCWPPAPEARKVSMRRSAGLIVDLDRIVDFRIDVEAGEAGVAAARGIEGRLAHQAMHAGFGAQEAVGVVALDLDGCAADAGDVAVGLFQQFGLEALAFAVLQVLTQQHRGPVAGFGAAGAGLDVDEAVVRVRRIVEHAAELEVGDQCFCRRRDRFRRPPWFRRRLLRGPVRTGRALRQGVNSTPESVSTTASRDFFSRPRVWARSASSQSFGSSRTWVSSASFSAFPS